MGVLRRLLHWGGGLSTGPLGLHWSGIVSLIWLFTESWSRLRGSTVLKWLILVSVEIIAHSSPHSYAAAATTTPLLLRKTSAIISEAIPRHDFLI